MMIPRYTRKTLPAAAAAWAVDVGCGQIHGRARLMMRAAVHVGGSPVGGSSCRRAASRSREGHSDARFVPVGVVAGEMVQLHQVPVLEIPGVWRRPVSEGTPQKPGGENPEEGRFGDLT